MGVVKKNKLSVTGSGSSGPGTLSKSASTAVAASSGAVTPRVTSNGAPSGWYGSDDQDKWDSIGGNSKYVSTGPATGLSDDSSGSSGGYSPFTKSSQTKSYEKQLKSVEGSRPGAFAAGEMTNEYLRRLQEAEDVKPEAFSTGDRTNEYLQRLQLAEDIKPEEFTPGDLTNEYLERLKGTEKGAPDPFQSKYTQQISNLLDTIQNPEKFDLKSNDTFQQIYNNYRDQYMAQGSRAMRDAAGSAAALSGGYGNSYAGTVASQAYDNYLQLINDRDLNIAQMALDDYWRERNDKYSQLGAVNSQDAVDYGRYRDEVSDWRDERDYLANRYDTQYARDYGKYRDDIADRENVRDYLANRYDTEYNRDYTQYRDDIADRKDNRDYLASRYDTSWNRDYGMYRDEVSDWQTDRSYYADRADNSYNRDYQMYESGRDQYNREADRLQAQNQFYDSMDWEREKSSLAQRNWQEQFDYQKEQDALQYALQLQKLGASGGSGGSGGGSGRGGSGGSGGSVGGSSASAPGNSPSLNREMFENNYDYYLNNFENGEEIADAYEAYTKANDRVSTGRTHTITGTGQVMEGDLFSSALDGYRRNYVQDAKNNNNIYTWDSEKKSFVRKSDVKKK